ncbi:ATP:cob(I)alamin adenosyltransferase [Kyrpidia spormannii]|uniref:Corrinoid adenosyltransferase n=2 Tax=Kyrpidia spormannii TaxID=2055160 RepID=A0A2K8N555_9BACL|nr:cob(I)yrinic acid a,c-diamide adenosyltransferase [Kyrpidia spormannii]ATY84215.1 ATP:cob(I)alamin adenosyltransferase [Kyrpidia spormannii]CAB3390562.1 putative ATP:cob(I)alamin adenosyltransferase [Kyrpidia spormannii]CAB3391479.1 putative ATP:cob(I)alamin adenosyltransferase [Kyrpidia spormannii]
MRIYTRSGDDGKTSLVFGRRIGKDSLRVDTYGTIDETNSAVGAAVALLRGRSAGNWGDVIAALERVQRELFDVGRELATPEEKREGSFVTDQHVLGLEKNIDRWEEQLPPLTRFILPGGDPAAAMLHLARTICRRAERRVVALAQEEPVADSVCRYLNRLSDFLFVAARVVNHRLGVQEPTVDFQQG